MNLRALAITLLICATWSSVVAAELRVDLSPDVDRKDVLSRDWENWKVAKGTSATRRFGDVTVTLRAAGSADALDTGWWKGGFDYDGNAMASDGVVVPPGGQIDLVLRGLSPGHHTIVTYHNALADAPPAKYLVAVDGEPKLAAVQPSRQATRDDDAASAFLEFDARDGAEVVITVRGGGSKLPQPIVLNGFEIDATDPARRALKPVPAHRDEHAPENPVLAWTAAADAASHRVYVGTDADAVARATPASPQFKGELREPRYPASGLNHLDTYFWRVDEVAADGETIRGDVWTFRVRHLAFPGAEGYGRFARGGRGGRVIEVTTLDDSGPGSLRAAVAAGCPRTVVFRVGGTIQLNSKLVIRNPYITIAGQTAPGDGIAVRGYTFGCLGARDVIMRYVRIRVGDESGNTMDGTGFASTDHAIYDHCSVSWSIDEAVSSRGAKNITLQRCIVAEALNVAGHAKYEAGKGHSYAGSISGDVGSFHHNLLAHCAGRNWSLAGGLTRGGKFAGRLDIRNNVVYNWQHRTNDGGVKALNLVANYYIPGPATKVFHLLKPDAGSPADPQQYFVTGNVMEGRPQYDADNWASGGVVVDPAVLRQVRLSEPFCEPYVTTHAAREAYDVVMADVGANLPRHDAVDRRVLADVAGRSFTFRGSRTSLPGIIDSQADAGGWPELKGGDAPADADHDGMADWWETARKLNPTDPADGNGDATGDGYTNLEKYLNWIVENGGLEPRQRAAR
jgi:hypothetical protein